MKKTLITTLLMLLTSPLVASKPNLEKRLPELKQNYPNPCEKKTNIDYVLPDSAQVLLIIYDNKGNPVKTLVDETQEPGKYNYEFDVSKHHSWTSPYRLDWQKNEVFFYRLMVDKFTDTKKIIKSK